MNKRTALLARVGPYLLLGLLLLVAGMLASCGPESSTPQARPTPPVGPVAMVHTSLIVLEATPTPVPVLLPDDENCVTCHTDEETLKKTAEKKEEKEKLSEGEG